MRKRRIDPYQRMKVWPTQRSENANETEFSERYMDVSAPGVIPPRGVAPVTKIGSIIDEVPVGTKPAIPVIRQARFVNLAVTVGLVATQLLASNQRRTYLIIQNTSASTIFVTFDRPASLATGVQILAGGNYEPITPPVSSVWAIALSADLSTVCIEGTT